MTKSVVSVVKGDDPERMIGQALDLLGGPLTPLTEPPYNAGVTAEPHPVAWSKVGIPHLCTRCCVHLEMAAIARTGYLTTVVERPADVKDPTCRWFFYKDLDDVPEEYYARIGARKPALQR